MKIKESDLFHPLNRYFNYYNYVINTEVELGKRADILLTKADTEEIIGIELKTSLSFELLDQASYWKQYTDGNYICIPKIKKDRPTVVTKILNYLEIGWIEIDLKRYNQYYKNHENDPYFVYLNHKKEPDLYRLGIKFNRVATDNKLTDFNRKIMLENIYEEHSTWAVGGSSTGNGTYVSTYKLLMKDVYDYLRTKDDDEWVTSKDIWEYLQLHSKKVVKEHYHGNVSNSIGLAIRTYEMGDIEAVKVKNKFHYKLMPESTKYLDMEKLKKRLGEEEFYNRYE